MDMEGPLRVEVPVQVADNGQGRPVNNLFPAARVINNPNVVNVNVANHAGLGGKATKKELMKVLEMQCK